MKKTKLSTSMPGILDIQESSQQEIAFALSSGVFMAAL